MRNKGQRLLRDTSFQVSGGKRMKVEVRGGPLKDSKQIFRKVSMVYYSEIEAEQSSVQGTVSDS